MAKPTAVWLVPISGFFTSALGTAIAALTVSADAVIRASELWVGTAGLVLAAFICLVAHIHVNYGRRVDEYEIEELPVDMSS